MHNTFLIVVCSVLLSSCAHQEPLTFDILEKIVIPKHYIVHKATHPLKIDGKPDEIDWQQTPYTDEFIDIEGIKIPKQNTKVKILWDDNYLYIYALLEETQIWATLKQRDTVIFYNNDFEVFIDPSDDTYDYGEIEINALNTVWDLMLDRPYRTKGKAINHWDTSLISAVHIEGTLNDSRDVDSYWAVEMAIPMVALIELRGSKQSPRDGDYWRLNFSRVEWDYQLDNKGRYQRKQINGKYAPEYNWVWSNQKVINMHEPEKWAYITFTDTPPGTSVDYSLPKDVLIRQVLFALFRDYLQANIVPNIKIGQQQYFSPIIINGDSFQVHYLRTFQGYNIQVSDSEQKYIYTINQDGLLKILPFYPSKP